MTFTRIGVVLAWLAIIFGGMLITLGIYVANMNPEAWHRYITGTPGEKIDSGIRYIAVGVVIGVLTEIRSALKKEQTDA